MKKTGRQNDGFSDTPQGAVGMLTPRRVAFAAALAFAEGLPGFLAPVKEDVSRCSCTESWGWMWYHRCAIALVWNIPLGALVLSFGAIVYVGLWSCRIVQLLSLIHI